jgi:hypothetical protein
MPQGRVSVAAQRYVYFFFFVTAVDTSLIPFIQGNGNEIHIPTSLIPFCFYSVLLAQAFQVLRRKCHRVIMIGFFGLKLFPCEKFWGS